jgi:hypothetical protein
MFQVMPEWCRNKDEAFEALAKRWLGMDEEFTAVSERNRGNRGSEGTHSVGSHSTDRYREELVHMNGTTCIYFPSCSFFIDITFLWRCRRKNSGGLLPRRMRGSI